VIVREIVPPAASPPRPLGIAPASDDDTPLECRAVDTDTLTADRHIYRAMKCGECVHRGMRVTAYHRGRDYRLLCRRRASTVRCASQVRRMSKREGSRAVDRGSDGTGD